MLTYDRVAVLCAFDLIEADTTTCVDAVEQRNDVLVKLLVIL